MVKETLVGIGVEWGSQILGLLDAAKFPIPVAAWVSAGDDGRLRLLLATLLYDRLGPAKAYLKLVNTLSSSDLDWSDSPLQLQSTRSPLVRELRKAAKRFPEVVGRHLGSRMLGGAWVEEAYIYRAEQASRDRG
jgi:hypothetical protein